MAAAAFHLFDAPRGKRLPRGLKVCTKCPERGAQPVENFAFSGKGYARQAICKPCDAERTRAWNAAHPERHARARRSSKLRQLYDLTPADYDARLRAQGGACKLCGRGEIVRARGGGLRRLAVDHCHRGGHVRGLLCHRCNLALGVLEGFAPGAEDWARRALAYLAEGALGMPQAADSPGAGTDKSGGSSGKNGPPSSAER